MIGLISHLTNNNKVDSIDLSEDKVLQSLVNLNINDENNDDLVPKIHIHDNKFDKYTKEKNFIEKNNSRLLVSPKKNTVNREPVSLPHCDRSSSKENIVPIRTSLSSLKLIKSKTKFFVTKSDNMHDIQLSYDLNLWSTTATASEKISKAYNNGANRVILFVSLNLSGKFYGALEIKSSILDKNTYVDVWENKQKSKKCFKVEWLVFKPVANRVLRHVAVTSDNEKPITSLKNGSEITAFSKGNEILDIMFRYVDF